MLTGKARWKEIMQLPITRAEASAMEDKMLAHIISTATAIEALETILVSKGILRDNELMEVIAVLLKTKNEQAEIASEQKSIVEA
jgi:hypothetical protein